MVVLITKEHSDFDNFDEKLVVCAAWDLGMLATISIILPNSGCWHLGSIIIMTSLEDNLSAPRNATIFVFLATKLILPPGDAMILTILAKGEACHQGTP